MHVLPRTLEAIDRQTYPSSKVTVMLVDGGSSDGTVDFGFRKGCLVINNPRTEPVFAKYLGFTESDTDLIVYLDHDEVYTSDQCLEHQVACMLESDVKAVISSGYLNPKGEHLINDYINEYGDPFSLFVYRISKSPEIFVDDLRKNYLISNETSQHCVVDFCEDKPLPLIELLAMGTLINKKYFIDEFKEIVDVPENLPHLFYILLNNETKIGVCKTHSLAHYSSESVRNYLKKISWRVRNNVHHTDNVGASGFLMREKLMAKRGSKLNSMKKYLFIPYSLFIFPALLDSIYLLVKRRRIAFIFHLPLCIYTSLTIISHMAMRSLGIRPNLRSYDGKKEIKND
jgi:glycosyltransferase involved in cell wall biosynthesis